MIVTVQRGDTLSRIAARNGTTVPAILRLNPGITNADRIEVGDSIVLPDGDILRPTTGGGGRLGESFDFLGPAGLYDHDLGVCMDPSLGAWAPPSATGVGSDPPWLVYAKEEMARGVAELAGEGRNARIEEYVNSTTFRPREDDWDDADVAWCSCFINWCMAQARQDRTNSAMAISWKELWDEGDDAGAPAYGAITVIRWHQSADDCRDAGCNRERDWGNPPAWLRRIGLTGCTKGHVGILVGTQGNKLVFLGGNQGNRVKLSSYSRDKVIGYMFPRTYSVPGGAHTLPEYSAAEVSAGTFAATR